VVTIRRGEIIGIFPIVGDDSSPLLGELRQVLETLRAHQIDESLGTSTVHNSLDAVP
jgi:hypothetical protein